jgi:hypothetical protein
MKRGFGYLSLIVGVFLLFLVPMLLIYAVPRIEKASTDTDETVVSNGNASYFSATQLQLVGPAAVQNLEVLKGDPAASTTSVAVIRYTSHLVNRATHASIDYDKEVYAMSRRTGEAEHCCGESPKMSGETLKFPFGTRKSTYQLWDPSANRSFPVHFVRTEDIQGVSAYRFQGSSPSVNIGTIGLPNSLVGVQGQGLTSEQRMYQADTTLFVEPVTGQVLKGEKLARQWAEDSAGTTVLELADVHVAYSLATVSHFVDQARTNIKQLKLVKRDLPLYGGILGAILAIVGALLLMGRPTIRTTQTAVVAAPA